MKRFSVTMFLALLALVLVLVSCDDSSSNDNETQVPKQYKNFYNYPTGRKSGTGMLEIRNNSNSKVLLFTDSVSPANYIGTAEGLNSIRVNLPEEKFYTIVAVDKAVWEERGDQSSPFSNLTYFSRTQPYSMSVNPNNTYGGGIWYIYNQTDYWVSFKAPDQSGMIYAVAPPKALRFSVPVQIGQNIDYVPHFYKELKYQGRVIGLVEFDSIYDADTVVTDIQNTTFYTNIGGSGANVIQPPDAATKPAIYFTNSAGRSVRVFSGTQNQLGAIGMLPGADFALRDGSSQMFTDMEDGVNTNSINILLPNGDRAYVSQGMQMQNNKVYRIVMNSTGSGPDITYSSTVTEEEASIYFN